MPVVIKESRPVYTEEALRAKINGTVLLSCVVEPDGTVSNVVVERGLDPGLDEQAVLAATGWRFTPGTKDGKRVRVRVELEMTFSTRG